MEIRITVDKKLALLMFVAMAAISAIGIAVADPPNPGHAWADIECSGCVTSSNVNFNYAGSSSKGGAASSVAWSGITSRPSGLDDGDDGIYDVEQATGTTTISAPSSITDMSGMSVDISTSSGGKLLVMFSANFWTSVNRGTGDVYIYIDGVQKRKATMSIYSNYEYLSFQHLETGLSAGSHNVKIRWSGSSIRQQDSERILTVISMD